MKTTSILYRARSLFLGVFAAAVICTGAAGAPAQQRPIEDFVNAQGTFGGPFAFLTWTDPSQGLFTAIDYAGLLDSFLGLSLGTEMSGKVTERALPDGRALVRVRLKTTNAWCFAVDGSEIVPSPSGV